MTNEKIVSPSSQVISTLPNYIVEQYERFVEFMTLAAESEERLGFSQDLLQKLHVYRNFDTYAKPIVESTILFQEINEKSESTEIVYEATYLTDEFEAVDTGRTSYERNLAEPPQDRRNFTKDIKVDFIEGQLVLGDANGFPEKNGILLIDEEVILYRYRAGNVCHDLVRGASATTALGDFLNPSEFRKTVPAKHFAGVKVHNISCLFMAAILHSIHLTYFQSVDSKRVARPIDRSSVLKHIRHFFQSKGTKLGIKALFKILFAENDVDVYYPGDRMIIPSKSSWYETKLLRVTTVPWVLTPMELQHADPDAMIGQELKLKSYNSNNIYGTIIVDYVSKYSFEDEIHYEIFVEKDNIKGDTVANPKTKLMRDLFMYGTSDDGIDVETITVESTLGFPESGVLIIGNEAITYEYKSFNQFFNCQRGYKGVDHPYFKYTTVHGPYYYEGTVTVGGEKLLSRMFPLGLVQDVDIRDPGVLHELTDSVEPNGPGRVDPREPIMGSFLENVNDQLVTINYRFLAHEYFGDYTAGPNGIYFDNKHVFVASSNLPYSVVGPFSDRSDKILGTERVEDFTEEDSPDLLLIDERNGKESVGQSLTASEHVHVIPRRQEIQDNLGVNQQIRAKGTDAIGVFADGVPAYSCVSPDREYQGMIAKYEIVEPGAGYKVFDSINLVDEENEQRFDVNGDILGTPSKGFTLLVDEKRVNEIVRLDEKGGVKSISVTEREKNYKTTASARITSGEGAEVILSFDKFGRVTGANLVNGGQYYDNVPSLVVTDGSGRGKGAVLGCQTILGSIISVEILYAGIDYDPGTTYAKFIPIGGGAVVKANIESYQYDRHYEIDNTDTWFYDDGDGFVFENKDDVRTNYAYIIRPEYLSTMLDDKPETRENHSPILGWAFDGNPIYGPIGYANKRDGSDGLTHYRSSYVLLPDRSVIYSAGHDRPQTGTLPPGEEAFPMGTFVEDYEYNPDAAIDKLREKIIIDSETPERLLADTKIAGDKNPKWLLYGKLPEKIDGEYPGLLDEYNSVVCNTPEFPKQLYPGGVRCYFLTVDYDMQPEYPYIIGPTFYNRPISQHLQYKIENRLDPLEGEARDPMSSYDETKLLFDYSKVYRHRNPYLSPTKAELELEISDTLDGGIKEIIVENGLPYSNKVGDILLYDSFDTGGAGAEGRIAYIEGENVVEGIGDDIKTVLLSHVQIINVNACVHLTPQGDSIVEDRTHVFERGSIIVTSGGAEAIVFNYDPDTTDLTVKTYTKNLIQYGELFRDNRDQLIKIPRLEDIGFTSIEQLILATEDDIRVMNESDTELIKSLTSTDKGKYTEGGPLLEPSVGNRTIFSVVEPDVEVEDLQAGDLWWSIQRGKLYIWYVDQDSTGQWVVTQPTGTIPMEGALDQPIAYQEPAERSSIRGHSENLVTISNLAPSERSDGSPNVYGDFWFSPHTNIMYMWFNMEWICTDPNGITPLAQSPLDIPNWPTKERIHPWTHKYETSLTVIVSLEYPRRMPDGSTSIPLGCLWFSPITGKTYIRVEGGLGSHWVMTNPLGMMPNEYALDTSGSEGGLIDPPPLRPGPELPPGHPDGSGGDLARIAGINYLWFEQLKYFKPEDTVQFYLGAPGTSANETAQLVSIAEGGAPAAAVVRRGDPMIEKLLDRTPTFNRTRALFTITTRLPHQMRVGDNVIIEGSIDDRLNGKHEVIDSGFIVPAEATVEIDDGKIVAVNITNSGKYYREDFYISFYSGGGVGGYAKCVVDPLALGGRVVDVIVEYGGIHYEFEPKIIWPEILDAHEFCIFTPTKVKEPTADFTYSTDSKYPKNKSKYIEVTSKGFAYERMPPIVGVYKKETDRAELEIEMRGTKIDKVNVLNPGVRYYNPVCHVVDLEGYGRGANLGAVTENGAIKEIVVYDGGELYITPQITIVEGDGKYISTTDNIGRIKSFDVIDPGRQISTDLAANPELLITTRAVIHKVEGEFKPGDVVKQGLPTYILFQAVVKEYREDTQILVMEECEGVLRNGEILYTDSTRIKEGIGYVVCEGQAETNCIVDGISSPRGDFLDDTSKVSARYACIQDSYYFQWFSYVISSPIQQSKYDSMVKKTIHPAGFIMFSDLTVHDMSEVEYTVNELELR